jgi:hypothetical protein
VLERLKGKYFLSIMVFKGMYLLSVAVEIVKSEWVIDKCKMDG